MDAVELTRLACFSISLAVFIWWERIYCRNNASTKVRFRWLNNFSIAITSSLITALLSPLLAFQAAEIATSHQLGLLNMVALSLWLKILIAIIALDCAIYWQHRLFHRIPMLWQVHRMHHTDTEVDITTGIRFHPFEIYLSLWIKVLVIVTLGLPAISVVIFEILLSTSALFTHCNVRIPAKLEARLRRILVTPNMHRIHHSIDETDHNSNFSFFLSIWDRLFISYQASPRLGDTEHEVGLQRFRAKREIWLDKLLTQPFRKR